MDADRHPATDGPEDAATSGSPPTGPLPAEGPGPRTAALWGGAVLVAAAVAAVLVTLCVLLRAAVVPLLIALLITALVEPLSRRMRGRGLPPAAAAALGCLTLVVVVGTALWVVVRLIADAASGLTASLQEARDRASGDDPFSRTLRGAADGLGQLGSSLGDGVVAGVLSGLGLAAQVLVCGVLTLALAFFLLRDRDKAVAGLRRVAPHGQEERVVAVARTGYAAMSGFMRGTTIIAGIDAAFITLGLTLLGVPHAGGLGALVFVGAYVPYAGAFLSGLTAVVVAFADGGLSKALWTLGIVLAVQAIEGAVLQPTIQSRTVSLHPAVVLLAIAAGASLGGLLGTLLAVPLTAAAVGIVKQLRSAVPAPDRAPGGPPGRA
ncbi:AI-2E family transporter [Kitasatospora sp. NPDC004240]